jgi:3',5'-cyclic AMP phosphodiesterase CpdA
MSMKRPAICLIFLLVLLGTFSTLCPAADDGSFAIIGDTRIGKSESVYVAFIDRMQKEGVHTVVHVGDAIDTPGNAEEWERLFKITGNKITLYLAPGNHDVNNRRSLAACIKATGREPYYSVAQNETLFLILNTELPDQEKRITGQQLGWLEKELARDFKYKFVFLHKPLFPTTFGTGRCLDRYPAERDRLHQLFVKHGVAFVGAGHQHLYDRSRKDGVLYVITGGGGALLHTFSEDYGGFMHYVVAKKRNGGYVFSVFDFKGTVRDEFSLRK